jgi:hypothetical protein
VVAEAAEVALAVTGLQQDMPLLLAHLLQSQLALVVRHLLLNTLLVEITAQIQFLAQLPHLAVVMDHPQVAALLLAVRGVMAVLVVAAHNATAPLEVLEMLGDILQLKDMLAARLLVALVITAAAAAVLVALVEQVFTQLAVALVVLDFKHQYLETHCFTLVAAEAAKVTELVALVVAELVVMAALARVVAMATMHQ